MIVAITGALGAGKGTVAQYLNKQHNFMYLSVRSFFAEEVLRRGQAATRENITAVARDLRTEKGPVYAIEQLLARAGRGGRGIVIESIRTMPETEYLKNKGATLWCINATLEERYKRFIGHALPVDAVPFEKFEENDKRDMGVDDLNNQNLVAVCQAAEVHIDNNGTKDELYAQIEEALKKE
jgi:dephospho-CoA kinase